MVYSMAAPIMFEYQAPATLNQASPAQNTWYTILSATEHVRVDSIGIGVEDTNETLEVRITVDGETINVASGAAANHSTDYYIFMQTRAISQDFVMQISTSIDYPARRAFTIEGYNVKVEVRKTTATGTGNLVGVVTYGVKK